jgi:7-carboxy-7-deazaguanine synthase
MLQMLGYQVAVETQGSYWNDALELADLVTCSPKPPSSDMITNWKILDKFAARLAGRIAFKVVVFDETDYNYAKQVYQRYPQLAAHDFYLQAGTPALGDDPAPYAQALVERLTWLVDRVTSDPDMAYAVPLFQMHTLLFGQRRGI